MTLWTRGEAAQYLGISVQTLMRLLKTKRIPHVRIGRVIRFTKESIDQYIERKTTTTWTPHGWEKE